MAESLADRLVNARQVPAISAADIIPRRAGYYSIWIDDPGSLPRLYADRLRADQTELIYVGIATKSLHKRLVEQDFHHKSPSTFFRGIGPILGFRPPRGSLVGKSNQNNYKFSKEDTATIISWIERHLSVRVVEEPTASKDVEAVAIRTLRPLLNSTHNPAALGELARLRGECRDIARETV